MKKPIITEVSKTAVETFSRARTVDKDFLEQLRGFRITTAEILYWMPDHKHVLQSFIWQNLDIHPRFPKLSGFLDFWESTLDGKVHKVTVGSAALISPVEFKFASEFGLQ